MNDGKKINIIVEGEVASGKTTILEVIHDALLAAGIFHTVVSMDLGSQSQIEERRPKRAERCAGIASKAMVVLEERNLDRRQREDEEYRQGFSLGIEGVQCKDFVSPTFMRGYESGLEFNMRAKVR